ncbi:MAG: NUDIX hydrolase [Chloroflexi bacterium]|nr:NUDIX hydrolase [Chloroflexota bacterium]MBV9545072.1 NUDIX hydrolase [Chloroflexota bacterium]
MESNKLTPNAVVAVDVVVFTLRPAAHIEDRWQVLLVRRDEPAFGNKLSLPGVLVRADETFDAAARRALQTRAGLDARDWYLEQLGTFGDPDRDSRGRVVSVAHVALVRSDELDLVRGSGVRSIDWVPVRRLPAETLAFDHADMLRVAINRIQAKLRYSWVAFQLMPDEFTLSELRAAYSAILDPSLERLNTSNFRKAFSALFATETLVPVGQRASIKKVGRPGELYRFVGPITGTRTRELRWDSSVSRPHHPLREVREA